MATSQPQPPPPKKISLSHISSGALSSAEVSAPPPPPPSTVPATTSPALGLPPTQPRRICLAQVNAVRDVPLKSKKQLEEEAQAQKGDEAEDEEEEDEEEYDDYDEDDEDEEGDEEEYRKTVPNTEAMGRILSGHVKINQKIKVANPSEVSL